jgi:hypothetical protein
MVLIRLPAHAALEAGQPSAGGLRVAEARRK